MTEIWVRRQPSDYGVAKCGLEDVKDIDWDDTSGGVGSGLPQYFLFGYVDCDKIIEGEVSYF